MDAVAFLIGVTVAVVGIGALLVAIFHPAPGRTRVFRFLG